MIDRKKLVFNIKQIYLQQKIKLQHQLLAESEK